MRKVLYSSVVAGTLLVATGALAIDEEDMMTVTTTTTKMQSSEVDYPSNPPKMVTSIQSSAVDYPNRNSYKTSDIHNEVQTDAVVIPNAPMITPSSIIELSAVGMGVAPESTISPAQALALAKRAAIVDAYRQIGEKMYGIRVNAQDTVRDMVLKNSTVKTKVLAVIRNAEVIETVYKDGLCQVSMELKLDGKRWYRILTGEEF